MEPIYARIRSRARQILARFPLPDFYSDFPQANEMSRRFLDSDAVVTRLHAFVAQNLEDDFGHGLDHARKVTWDAGALMLIEGRLAGYSDALVRSRLRMVQSAGLLHDIKRKRKDHAEAGAAYARTLLADFSFSADEIDDICLAIRNHEAFKQTVAIDTPEGALLANCLYDADKFRWGPDNFHFTVWDMVSFFKISLGEFIRRYPEGMAGLAEIRNTFRTGTGRRYGPQFIDIGIAVGNELLAVIQSEFGHLL